MVTLATNDMDMVVGASYTHDFDLFDSAGAVIDMTDANKTLHLEFKGLASLDGTTISRTTGTSGHRSWRSQANGRGTWRFTSTETAAYSAGDYIVGIYYKDSGDTDLTPRFIGSCRCTIRAAPTTVP